MGEIGYRLKAIPGEGIVVQHRSSIEDSWSELGYPTNNRASLQLWITEYPNFECDVTPEVWAELAAIAWPKEK
ncbi:MAG: hypothetical protein ACXABY_00815 [Candidatus Thorarchaeota archaeon]|jgi:hypothetical protein